MTDDYRFTRPLYTAAQAARYVGMPRSTFHAWARGYTTNSENAKKPVITSVDEVESGEAIPFIGLVEATVIQAFRQTHLPMQRIRRALEILAHTGELDHALASNKLYSDGASILFDHAGPNDPTKMMVTVIDGQRVFHETIQHYLKRIEFGDTWAKALVLPVTPEPLLRVVPDKGMGQPLFIRGNAPLASVTDRLKAGESVQSVARDFDMEVADVKEAAGVFAPETLQAA